MRGAAGARRLLAVLHGRCLTDPAALGGVRAALEHMDSPEERGLVVAGMVAAGAGEFAGYLSAEMPDLVGQERGGNGYLGLYKLSHTRLTGRLTALKVVWFHDQTLCTNEMITLLQIFPFKLRFIYK